MSYNDTFLGKRHYTALQKEAVSMQAFENLHVSEEQSSSKSFWTEVVSLSYDNYQEHIYFSTQICIQVLTVVWTNLRYFIHFSPHWKLIHSNQKKILLSP